MFWKGAKPRTATKFKKRTFMPNDNLFSNGLHEILYRPAQGFVPSRIILVNYWLYNDVAFYFAQGRLFLTGHNGSGKSTALTAAVTSLLDGNTRPERLDPFGGGRRSLRYYILGGTDAGFEYANRRSYIALEFRNDDGSFQTIGLGLQASDGSSDIRKWGFSVPAQVQALGGIQLVQDSGEPVSRRQLEELIAKQGGRVVEGGDYEELVRKTVFAGANETNFRDLIELLLTVRGAKLGREVKPSVIETLLRRSLPQVSHDVVEQLSSGIEGIDRHADTVKRIESQLEAAREIARAHFERALSNAQFEFAREKSAKIRDLEARTARDTARVQLSEFRLRLEDVQTQDTNVKLEQEGVQAEADVLTSQLEDAEGALLRTESDLENVRREVKRVGDALRRGNEWLERSNLETEQLSASKIQNQQNLELTLEGLSKLSWWNALDPDSSLAGRNESLGFAQNAVRDFERDTERLRDRELEERRAFDQTQAAKESLEARTFEFENVMRETAQSLTQEALQMFPLEKPQLEAYQDALEVMLEPLEAAITLEPLIQPFIVEARGLLEERRDVRKNLETKLKTYQDQLQHLESQTEVAPKLPIDRAKASAALEAAGIAHRAFFECIKPKPNTKNLAQLEAGLLESGLLTALIVTAKDRPRALDVLNTEKLADALLMPGEAASQNLSTLLEPESDALNETHQILQSISLERANSQASVSDTHWANGLLTGSASTTASEARFIGVVARTQERARQLEVLRKQISDLEQELESSTNLERQAFDDLTRLETAWTKLREARLEANQRRTAQNARERARDAFQTRVETHERALVQLETARNQAKTAVAKLEESFLSLGIALENSLTDEFEASPRERLNKAQLEFQNAQNNQRQIVVFKASIEQILARLEAVATEQNDRRGELETSSFERAQLETKRDVLSEQLEMMRKEFETPDRADQRTRLNKAKARLSALRREHEELLTKLIEARGQIKLLEERLPELERNANNRLGELERAEQKLQDAKNVHPKLASLVLESKLGNEALETQRREREIDLDREFHLHKHTLETPESFQPILTPTGVRFTLEGASTQPDELLEHFSQNLEEAVRLLSDEEARVFHDELISTLAEELDTRIREAREWVRGVRVTLKTLAFHDERLDLELEARQTDGLARLLDGKKDPSYQPETWRSSLREELRNIVRGLRENGSNSDISFPQALARAFDYREWYGFKFFSMVGADDGTRRREITDRSFQSRSGGERSAVLYTFLFAALGARFDALGSSVPRLIGLDEAFAGMDAVNISALYKVMTALELSWVATSERRIDLSTSLPAAATYQLFRATSPNGDDGVSSLAFLWNGLSLINANGLL